MSNRSRHAEPRTARSGLEELQGPYIQPLLDVWTTAADKAVACGSAAQFAGTEIAQGWLRFVGERIAKDIALPKQLAACGNANDAFLVYTRFWEQAAKDYWTEFSAITDAMWIATQPALGSVGEGKAQSQNRGDTQ